MKFVLCFLLFVISFAEVNCQINQLSFYADVMANANLSQHRVYAENQFRTLLTEEIQKQGVNVSFIDQINGISVIKLDFFKSRLLTWQYKKDDNTYVHNGIVISEDKKITNLTDQSLEQGDRSYDILTPDEWHGAYYYDALYDSVAQCYILFGFNGTKGDQYEKLADIISKDEKGNWIFGKEVFLLKEDENRPDIKTRIAVAYSPTSVVSLRYDKDTKMIIHDYTIAAANDFDGKWIGKVPDGTYVGYEKKGKYWKIIEKLENTPVEEIKPDYNTKRDASKPDIFGRSTSKPPARKKRNQ